MKFTKALIIFFVAFGSKASATSMGELIRMKYADIYNPRQGEPFTFENEEGTVETIEILPPLSIHTPTMMDPDFIRIMDEFEVNPAAAFTDKRFKTYLIHHAVRDYEKDFISREIVNRCLQYGPDRDFLLLLLNVVVNHNLEDLFDEIMGQYDTLSLDQREIFPVNTPLANTIVSSGNYHFAKRLITAGRYPASASYMAATVCSYGNTDKIQEAIDFLEFLLVQREEFDVNEPVWTLRFNMKIPLLLILLDGNRRREYKEAIGKFLVAIGADVNYRNNEGKTILELAGEQDINLF